MEDLPRPAVDQPPGPEPGTTRGREAPEATPRAPAGAESAELAWMTDLGMVPTLIGAALLLYLVSLFRLLSGEQVHGFYEGGLLHLLVVGLLGPSFIRTRRLALRGILDQFASQEPVFREMYRDFLTTHELGWRPILAGSAVAVLFLGFRLLVTWELIPYAFEGTRLVMSLLGALAWAVFIRSLWILLAFGYLVSRMSLEFERLQDRLFSWELLERAGTGYARTAFGASFASLALFWAAVASRGLVNADVAGLAGSVSTLFGLLVLALIIPLAYLVVPIWRLHRILVHRKLEIRKLFEGEFTRTEREFLERPRREMAWKYLTERQAIEEVEKLPEWPFRFETLAKVLTLVAVPAGLFFFKEVLVDVLVGVLKQR